MSTDISSLFPVKESKWQYLKRLIGKIDSMNAFLWIWAAALVGSCAIALILELVKKL